MPEYDLVITGGTVLDPASSTESQADVAVSHGKIELVRQTVPAGQAAHKLDATGKWVMPGLIDSHAHFAGKRATWDPALGHAMLAAAGTTTAIDFGSTPEDLFEGTSRKGAGLNVAGLLLMRPGHTIPRDDPPPAEIRRIVSDALARGAIGIKITGGYYPFTPEVTADFIAECNRQRAYMGYHVGTKKTGSRLDGLREVPSLVGERGRVHIAHINAYCRGSILPALQECQEALEIISAKRRQYNTEVHQAVPNGTSGRCGPDGTVLADVARNCLKLRGYPTTADGIRQAMREGYASAIAERDGRVVFVRGAEALALFDELNTELSLSFPVNLPSSAFALSSAKYPDGEFICDAIATDGGSFPRNIAVESAMAMVRFGALSPLEMAKKLSLNPAVMFGLTNKGRVAPGFDADFTVIDPAAGKAVAAIVGGRVIMKDGQVTGRGGTLLVTAEGRKAATGSGLPHEVLDLTKSKLYAGFE